MNRAFEIEILSMKRAKNVSDLLSLLPNILNQIMKDKLTLLADGGSTKIDWVLLKNDAESMRFSTPGVNPSLLQLEDVISLLDKYIKDVQIDFPSVDEICFYGAGCRGKAAVLMHQAFTTLFVNAEVHVHTDLLAAARALCGDACGLVCILGTGSNSCMYDGKEIVRNVSPLGYILGDEGSGAVLGKRLAADVFKEQFPDDLCEKFKQECCSDIDTLVQHVYREPFANRYLAGFTKYLSNNIQRAEIQELVVEEFERFFVRNISVYQRRELPVNFVGSIAWFFRAQLEEAAQNTGFRIGCVLRSPMEGLLRYHGAEAQ